MTDEAPLRELHTTVGGLHLRARHGAPTGHADDPTLPVVLVHGFGMSGDDPLPTARLLAARRPAWVPDLPGHGRSATPPRALDVPGLARALLAWLDAVGVPRAALLGNSMGAQIVAEAARLRPGIAAALVLVGPTFDPRHPRVPGLVLRVLADVPRERPALVPIVVRDYLRMGPARLWREFVGMRAHPMRTALRGAAVPTLVVRGAHDPLASGAWCAELAETAGGRGAAVAGAGHAVNFSAAPALARLVDAFLDGLPGPARAPLAAAAGASPLERANVAPPTGV